MTKDQIKEILERVLTWPAERQEYLANIVLSMESSFTTVRPHPPRVIKSKS